MPHLHTDDRGYLYGDALFETMRVWRGRVCWLEAHRARMLRSASVLEFSPARVEAAFDEVVQAASQHEDGLCRVTLSREGGDREPFGGQGSCTLRWRTLPDVSGEVRLGVERATYFPDDDLAEHKTSNYLRSIMARKRAMARGFDDALRLSRDGRVGECSASNVFFVMGGEVVTPKVEGILPGVMRGAVIRKLKADGVGVEERAVWHEELLEACEACWVTSVGVGVRDVAYIEQERMKTSTISEHVRGWLSERGWP